LNRMKPLTIWLLRVSPTIMLVPEPPSSTESALRTWTVVPVPRPPRCTCRVIPGHVMHKKGFAKDNSSGRWMGVNQDPRQKANADYVTRTSDPAGWSLRRQAWFRDASTRKGRLGTATGVPTAISYWPVYRWSRAWEPARRSSPRRASS
jgi:hypothetical protein